MPIKLIVKKRPPVKEKTIGAVKITAEAETILRKLARETGLSCRSLVSQIVIQAADQIEIREI